MVEQGGTAGVENLVRIPTERRRYEAVVDGLLELIEDRGLGPGDAMPTERELAEVFGVSRSVLRQAFGILEDRGLINTLRGSGRYLRDAVPSESVGTEAMPGARSRFEVASIADVLEARTLVETQIAMLACERRTSEEAQRLTRVAEQLVGWEDNVAFHLALASCTHNFMLERMVREQMELSSELHQREHYRDPDQLQRMRNDHLEIAWAVTARDTERAEELVRTHLRGTNRLLHQLDIT